MDEDFGEDVLVTTRVGGVKEEAKTEESRATWETHAGPVRSEKEEADEDEELYGGVSIKLNASATSQAQEAANAPAGGKVEAPADSEDDEDEDVAIVLSTDHAGNKPTLRFTGGGNRYVRGSFGGPQHGGAAPGTGALTDAQSGDLGGSAVDGVDDLAMFGGRRTAFDVDIDLLEDRPWRKPGVDISDYFNYGFDEHSWREYAARQLRLRRDLAVEKSREQASRQAKMKTMQEIILESGKEAMECPWAVLRLDLWEDLRREAGIQEWAHRLGLWASRTGMVLWVAHHGALDQEEGFLGWVDPVVEEDEVVVAALTIGVARMIVVIGEVVDQERKVAIDQDPATALVAMNREVDVEMLLEEKMRKTEVETENVAVIVNAKVAFDQDPAIDLAVMSHEVGAEMLVEARIPRRTEVVTETETATEIVAAIVIALAAMCHEEVDAKMALEVKIPAKRTVDDEMAMEEKSLTKRTKEHAEKKSLSKKTEEYVEEKSLTRRTEERAEEKNLTKRIEACVGEKNLAKRTEELEEEKSLTKRTVERVEEKRIENEGDVEETGVGGRDLETVILANVRVETKALQVAVDLVTNGGIRQQEAFRCVMISKILRSNKTTATCCSTW
ncbi:Pre-mRNA polyadenylation factor [Phytophthora megakarya]|uniref:Pre-mRNA polyadenylation factor n=1 Tax=Phytophthora megakarya TaxID=4795 RepID=A0A225WQK4_9STRA|nr:Pre-mRNA polyadenylation factor [Phytophthora megakarya]